MPKMNSVSLGNIIKRFELEVLWAPEGYEDLQVTRVDVNRPGLQLSGFFDYFDEMRLQVIGLVETSYLAELDREGRRLAFDRLFRYDIPAFVISRDLEPYEECMEMARKHGKPVLRTADTTSEFMSSLISYLKWYLSPCITRHGVLVEIYGEGVLLLGESGVGKSETAIELVKRGHLLIADDAVEIKRVAAHRLEGSAPEIIRHYIELRGIGVVDVRQLFGMSAVKKEANIDLVINLETWKDDAVYDRLGTDSHYTSILDVEVPILTIPVKPGRNLAVIIEVAAMNNRNKKLGYNAALEFTQRVNRQFDLPMSGSGMF